MGTDAIRVSWQLSREFNSYESSSYEFTSYEYRVSYVDSSSYE
jgi:hypothetical protein